MLDATRRTDYWSNKHKVLVVGNGLYALNTIDYVRRRIPHAEIHLLSTNALDWCQWSPDLASFIPLDLRPDREQEEREAWIVQVDNCVSAMSIDLVVPVVDEGLFLVDLYHADPRFLISNSHFIKGLHSKVQCMAMLSACKHVALPRTEVCDASCIDENTNKFVYKPEFSRGKVYNKPEQQGGRWVRQARIFGQEFSSLSLFVNGSLEDHTCYAPSEMFGGFSTVRTVSNEWVFQQSLEIVRQVVALSPRPFTGFLGFDYMLSEDDQLLYIIECNPRITNGICFFQQEKPLLVTYISIALLLRQRCCLLIKLMFDSHAQDDNRLSWPTVYFWWLILYVVFVLRTGVKEYLWNNIVKYEPHVLTSDKTQTDQVEIR